MPDDLASRQDEPSWLRLPPPPAPGQSGGRSPRRLRSEARLSSPRSARAGALARIAACARARVDALAVSVENRCEPCVFSHAAQLVQITGDPVLLGTIEVNWRRAALTAREAALAYAGLTRRPAEVERADLDALRAPGLGRRILEAAAVVAYFNLSSR